MNGGMHLSFDYLAKFTVYIIESSIKGSLKFKGHGDGSVWEGDNHRNMVNEAKAKAERRYKNRL